MLLYGLLCSFLTDHKYLLCGRAFAHIVFETAWCDIRKIDIYVTLAALDAVYSAGYYSYKWAEVLDADAFELFLEKGLFDKATAKSFKENILSRGGTEHPMELYKRFRGREPDPKALLKREGLI